MANPNAKPPVHSQFKPGQSGNPGGRKKAKLTIEKMREIIDAFSIMTVDQVREKLKDPKTTMIEMQIGNTFLIAAEQGDYQRMTYLLDRMIGKVPNANVNVNADAADLEDKSTGELLKIVESKYPELKKSVG